MGEGVEVADQQSHVSSSMVEWLSNHHSPLRFILGNGVNQPGQLFSKSLLLIPIFP